MYRLLFLFYAESRELLPLDNEIYQSYSLESLRDDVHSVQDDPDPRQFFAKGNTELWTRLKELFGFLDKGWGKVIPPYNGGLFDPEKHTFLESFAVGDHYLALAIDLLSRTKPRAGQSRGEGRKKVTYRDLDVRHLGSIYEGILEYSAHIADQDYLVLRRGSAAEVTEEYKAVADLDGSETVQFAEWQQAVEENRENPRLPRGCRVSGHVEKGQYYLVFGGESPSENPPARITPQTILFSKSSRRLWNVCPRRVPTENRAHHGKTEERRIGGPLTVPLGCEERSPSRFWTRQWDRDTSWWPLQSTWLGRIGTLRFAKAEHSPMRRRTSNLSTTSERLLNGAFMALTSTRWRSN